MQHQRHIHSSVNFLQTPDIQVGRILILAMGISDGDGKGIHACFPAELFCRLRLCIEIRLMIIRIRRRTYMADLSLHENISLMCCKHYFLCHGNICIQVIHGAIHHNGAKACPNRSHDCFVAVIVVAVKPDRHLYFLCKLLYHCSIFLKSSGMLNGYMLRKQHYDGRSVRLLCRINHRPGHHIVHADKCDCRRIALLCHPQNISCLFVHNLSSFYHFRHLSA